MRVVHGCSLTALECVGVRTIDAHARGVCRGDDDDLDRWPSMRSDALSRSMSRHLSAETSQTARSIATTRLFDDPDP